MIYFPFNSQELFSNNTHDSYTGSINFDGIESHFLNLDFIRFLFDFCGILSLVINSGFIIVSVHPPDIKLLNVGLSFISKAETAIYRDKDMYMNSNTILYSIV